MINCSSKEIQFIEFSELKEKLNNTNNPLPDLELKVLKNLREQIVEAQCITSAIILKPSKYPNKYELIDGFSRYSLLHSIIEENKDFNTLIPIVVKQLESRDEALVFAIRNQLSRRNLDKEDIILAVNRLRELGKSKGQAVKEVSEITGKSKSSIYRGMNPDSAQKERDRQQQKQQDEKSNEALLKLENSQVGNCKTSNYFKENINSPIVSTLPPKIESKLEGLNNLIKSEMPSQITIQEDIPSIPQLPIKKIVTKTKILEDRSKEELSQIENDFTYSVNEKGETEITFTPSVSRLPNELDKLLFIEDNIKELNADLSKFQNTEIYNELKALVEKYYLRVNYLNKNSKPNY